MQNDRARFSVTDLIARVRGWLIRTLVRYLAAPLDDGATVATGDLRELAAILNPGDVLLTAGNTRLSALVKRFTQSTWSHVAMYVGPLEAGPDPRCVVEADVADGVRAIRLSELNAKRIRVLRPQSLSAAERGRLAESVVGSIGSDYDIALAWMLGCSRVWPAKPARPARAQAPVGTTKAFICSTLVAHAFALAGYTIQAPRASESVDGHVTPADFEHAPLFTVAWSANSTVD